MKRRFFNRFLIGCMLISLLSLASCREEPAAPIEHQRLILIYAVASNSLYSNFLDDMREVVRAGKDLDLVHNKVLVYSVIRGGDCKLQELIKDQKGNYTLSTVMTYPQTPLSVEEERISDVLNYVNDNYDYPYKGLILWSHATGWTPWFGTYPSSNSPKRWFGEDQFEGKSYYCNITSLAKAIPDGVFDFIWFDCCYMANIETVYQLRGKTDKIIGYVTEIYANGMPYDATLPYLLRANPDIMGAAFALFASYDAYGEEVTVSVMDTSGLDHLAEAASRIFEYGTPPTSFSGIHNYSRLTNNPFYDMGTLMESYTGISDTDISVFKDAMERVVVYKLASERDFDHKYIDPKKYSGLTMHNYVDNGSAGEDFYTTLDWYRDTRK